MQFKTQSVIKAMKPSKGVIEDTGRPYDSTKVYIETQFSSDAEGWGNPSIQYNWGTSDNYHDFMRTYGITKEFTGEVTWENQTTGNNSKLVVIDVKPNQPTKA
ncbi:hypothetical protein ACI2IV_00060 [Psychrobacter faecalis]